MSSEQESLEVSSLHFDFASRRLLGVLADQSVLQFTLTPDLKLLYTGRFKTPATPEVAAREAVVHQVEASAPPSDQLGELAPSAESPRTPERQAVQTLTGRLIDDVKPGRTDSRGNPTSWAPALLHVEGEETAQRVAITFHRHTTQEALDHLHQSDRVTVEGYLRPAPSPKPGEIPRMSAFSAFRLIDYPGKPLKT